MKDFTELIQLTEEADSLIMNRPEEVADDLDTVDGNEKDKFVASLFIAIKRLMMALSKVQEAVYLAAETGAKLLVDQCMIVDHNDKENAPRTEMQFVEFEDLDEKLKQCAQAIRAYNQLMSFDHMKEDEAGRERKKGEGRGVRTCCLSVMQNISCMMLHRSNAASIPSFISAPSPMPRLSVSRITMAELGKIHVFRSRERPGRTIRSGLLDLPLHHHR